jgi:peptide/nickel transport system permease protein
MPRSIHRCATRDRQRSGALRRVRASDEVNAPPPPASAALFQPARSAGETGDRFAEGRPGSAWRLIGATFFENKLARVGFVFMILEIGFCFIGPLVYRTNQFQSSVFINLAPSSQHPLGTDNNGFDILGRLMTGGRVSLEISFGVAVCSTVLGMLWGAISGFAGGRIDGVMSRLLDVFISIPPLFVFIYLATVYRPTLLLLILVLSGLSWLVPARLVRGETLALRTREYVQAAQLMGGQSTGIMRRHIFHNVIGTIVVSATFQITNAILVLATLDFFGFGLPPPTPTWGGMLSNGINYLYDGYWWQIYPEAALIVCTVVAISFIGDALRDAFDVRLQRR